MGNRNYSFYLSKWHIIYTWIVSLNTKILLSFLILKKCKKYVQFTHIYACKLIECMELSLVKQIEGKAIVCVRGRVYCIICTCAYIVRKKSWEISCLCLSLCVNIGYRKNLNKWCRLYPPPLWRPIPTTPFLHYCCAKYAERVNGLNKCKELLRKGEACWDIWKYFVLKIKKTKKIILRKQIVTRTGNKKKHCWPSQKRKYWEEKYFYIIYDKKIIIRII